MRPRTSPMLRSGRCAERTLRGLEKLGMLTVFGGIEGAMSQLVSLNAT